jgi:pentatricopeptide repeat protein
MFRKMQSEGPSPNAVTFICTLKACGGAGYLEMGEEIYELVRNQGLIEKDIAVGTAIVDMYAKCGMLGKAQLVFDDLPVRNIVSWNSLIAGYGQTGQMKRVLRLSGKMMEEEGITPDCLTFLTLLSAHSHEGLVEEGQRIFNDMDTITWSFSPAIEHYTCMVDLYSCVGRFDKAIALIEKVPNPSHRLPLWWALLGACCKWVNVEVGRWAFQQSLKLSGNHASVYVCMRNIYAAAGMHEEANDIETWRIQSESHESP